MKWVQRRAKISPQLRDNAEEKIAKIRGIKDYESFLSPTKDEMFNPYLIKNIEIASNRIIRAIKNNENIVVAFDPDADGLTATTTMIRYLRNYTYNIDFIFGERNDGHGIHEMTKIIKSKNEETNEQEIIESKRNEQALENITKIKNSDLLILVDSSTNDVDTCKQIVEATGIDIIIIDHHAIEKENPYVILVNPQQDDDEYPNKQLSGAGVVFKTIQVMEDTLGKVDPFQYIDLVAVGMYSD